MAGLMRKASRKRTKARIGIAGPSGSGKTMSSLLIAYGLAGDWNKIGLIDTESGSGELYSNMPVKGLNLTIGEYNYIRIDPPFTVAKYLDAVKEMETAGIEVIIIDSTTHAWAGSGGLLDKHGKLTDASKTKNSYTAWRTITPEHNQLVETMLQSKSHIIATIRSKQEYAQTKDENTGRTTVEKLGMAPIQREGMDYEFTVMFDIEISHVAHASKDRTSLYDGLYFKIEPNTGKKYVEWMMGGKDEMPQQEQPRQEQPKQEQPKEAVPNVQLPESLKEVKEELAKAFEGTVINKQAVPEQTTTQTASPTPPPSQPSSAPAQTDEKKIQPAQLKYIMTKITTLFVKTKKCDMETVKTCLKDQFKIEHMNEIKASQFNAVTEWLEEFAKEEKPK